LRRAKEVDEQLLGGEIGLLDGETGNFAFMVPSLLMLMWGILI
jgi:hypothetical protein